MIELTRNCLTCKKLFMPRQYDARRGYGFYCSKKCYYGRQKKVTEIICGVCGKKKIFHDSEIRKGGGKYCSKECADVMIREFRHTEETKEIIAASKRGKKRPFMTGAKHPRWKGGLMIELYSREFNKELKERIRKRDDNRCQFTGHKPTDRKINVHYIDYNKKNNKLYNLISLCSHIHALTNENREKWQFFFESYQEIRLSREVL